jgi:hypothetical protein
MARRRYPEVDEQAVRLVLGRICATIERCPGPAAFLPFALQALRGAARPALQQRGGRPAPPSTLDEQGYGQPRRPARRHHRARCAPAARLPDR